MFRAALSVIMLIATPAMAEGPLRQCAQECALSQGPVGTSIYDLCVAHRCGVTAPGPQAVESPVLEPLEPEWQVESLPDSGAYTARIRFQGRSLSYVCQPDGRGMIAVEGLGSGGGEMVFLVDGQRMSVPFQTLDGIHYGEAEPGSQMLRAMMEGRQATMIAGQITLTMPLIGSARAITEAMRGCDLIG